MINKRLSFLFISLSQNAIINQLFRHSLMMHISLFGSLFSFKKELTKFILAKELQHLRFFGLFFSENQMMIWSSQYEKLWISGNLENSVVTSRKQRPKEMPSISSSLFCDFTDRSWVCHTIARNNDQPW